MSAGVNANRDPCCRMSVPMYLLKSWDFCLRASCYQCCILEDRMKINHPRRLEGVVSTRRCEQASRVNLFISVHGLTLPKAWQNPLRCERHSDGCVGTTSTSVRLTAAQMQIMDNFPPVPSSVDVRRRTGVWREWLIRFLKAISPGRHLIWERQQSVSLTY
jgi:hypothetical protein